MSVIATIRDFNRFYTNFLGIVNPTILGSKLSLTESRVLYEIAYENATSYSGLLHILKIDKGYLSRIIKSFEKKGIIQKEKNNVDARSSIIKVTEKGIDLLRSLEMSSDEQISNAIHNLNEYDRERLTTLLRQTRYILEYQAASSKSLNEVLEEVNIRTEMVPGDLGQVIKAHGDLYNREYNYGVDLEYYVIKAISNLYESLNNTRSTIWICETSFQQVGSIALQDHGTEAQLRFFYLDPLFRGLGLGKELMNKFMTYLNEQKFEKCFLWTTKELNTAKGLYEENGFQLVEEKPSDIFGRSIIEQKYQLINE